MQPNLMNQNIEEDDDDLGAIDLGSYQEKSNESIDDELNNSAINLDEYSKSPEAQEVDWWDWTKDVAVQSVRGVAQAFSWPLDILKLGMLGEGLSGIDDLEELYLKQGKEFDRDRYIKTLMELGEYIPTQSFFEGLIEDYGGVSLQPKTESGKFVNKAATIAGLTKGSGLTKLVAGATAGGTTQGLKALGVNETVSEIAGDVTGGLSQALKKGPRQFTPEVDRLMKIADKHGLPFYEFMTRPEGGMITPKISRAREAAVMKELGMTSEQAAKEIVEGRLPISKLRNSGVNLEKMEKDSYDKARNLAASKPQNIDPSDIISEIEAEVSRIKKIAPSLSDDNKEIIRILENEKAAFQKSLPNQKAPKKGQPAPKPVPINSEQLINQHIEYNKNVKGIYKKPEIRGKEEATRDAYAFLNSSIRNTMEKQAGSDVSTAFKEANSLFSQNAILKSSEDLINKAFVDGIYNPKKLKQVLNSKQGIKLRKNLGDKAIEELYEIADYGQKAVSHTSQVLNNPKYKTEALSWGSLAPLVLGSTVKMKGALYLAKPVAERVKGYLLSRPASRTAYTNIIKNAAKGSFNNMKADFAKLEESISDEFGSADELVKKIINDLEVYEGNFD